MSLAQLGRFAEAAEYEAEAIRLAEPTHRANREMDMRFYLEQVGAEIRELAY